MGYMWQRHLPPGGRVEPHQCEGHYLDDHSVGQYVDREATPNGKNPILDCPNDSFDIPNVPMFCRGIQCDHFVHTFQAAELSVCEAWVDEIII